MGCILAPLRGFPSPTEFRRCAASLAQPSSAALRLPYPTEFRRFAASLPNRVPSLCGFLPNRQEARWRKFTKEKAESSLRRAVAGALQHADVGKPGTDRRAVLVGHHTRYLVEMSKIVDCPGREQF